MAVGRVSNPKSSKEAIHQYYVVEKVMHEHLRYSPQYACLGLDNYDQLSQFDHYFNQDKKYVFVDRFGLRVN
jgi:predicted metallopeptidase